jgi:hypothetical protein
MLIGFEGFGLSRDVAVTSKTIMDPVEAASGTSLRLFVSHVS